MLLRAIWLPLTIALLPLAGMAILQFALPVLAPLMTAEVGRSPEAYGWLGGALGLGSIWFMASSHAVLPCFGPVRTLRLGLCCAITGILLLLSGIWPVMIAGALLIGFGYGTTTPSGSQVLADFTPRAAWGVLFSMRMAAVPVGGIVAGALGTWVATTAGWRAALYIVVLVCAAIALLLLAIPRRFNESRTFKPFAFIKLFDPSNLRQPVRCLRAIPGLPTLVAASWCLSVVHATVTSFFVIYLHAGVGLPLTEAAALFALLQGVAIVGRIGFGALADAVGSPLPVLKILAPLSGASALMLSQVSADWSGLAHAGAAVVIGLTVGTWNGLYLAEVARLAPADAVGEATASAAFFGFTAYMIAPPAAGALFTTVGYRPALQLVALFSLLALAIFVLRDRAANPAVSRPTRRDRSMAPRRAGWTAFGAGFAALVLVGPLVLRSDHRPWFPAVASERWPPATALRDRVWQTPDLRVLLAQSMRSPLGVAATGITADAALKTADAILAMQPRPVTAAAEARFWLQHAIGEMLWPQAFAPALPDQRHMTWALTQLGVIFATPAPGEPQDYAAARQVWEIAGLLGDPVAVCFEAQLHMHGLGVPVSVDTASTVLRRVKSTGGCQADR